MKDTKPKDITRLDGVFALFLLIFIVLIIVLPTCYMMYVDNLDTIFIEQAEKDCRKANGYLEKDTVGRVGRLKQVFCWDSSGEKLLFKKAMKYD